MALAAGHRPIIPADFMRLRRGRARVTAFIHTYGVQRLTGEPVLSKEKEDYNIPATNDICVRCDDAKRGKKKGKDSSSFRKVGN